jgi:hypothetical protein
MENKRQKRCDSCKRRVSRLTYVAIGEWKGKRLCDECLLARDALKALK